MLIALYKIKMQPGVRGRKKLSHAIIMWELAWFLPGPAALF
jgi:hypothetical protein